MASTPIFEQLCQEHLDAGAAHPLADLAVPEADQLAVGQEQARSDEQTQAGETPSDWEMPEDKAA